MFICHGRAHQQTKNSWRNSQVFLDGDFAVLVGVLAWRASERLRIVCLTEAQSLLEVSSVLRCVVGLFSLD